jgi:hypothetical protein
MTLRFWLKTHARPVANLLQPGDANVGACLRKLDLHLLSALLFKDTLEIDQLGVSPRLQILDLPEMKVLSVLKRWSDSTTES